MVNREDFERHIKKMAGFHQCYMVSNKVCKLWVNDPQIRRANDGATAWSAV